MTWDEALEAALRRRIDGKTKPSARSAASRTLAAQVARASGIARRRGCATCQLTIFAADHGLAAEGVSAYPQAVTRQMLAELPRRQRRRQRLRPLGRRGAPRGRRRRRRRADRPPATSLSRRIGPGTRNALARAGDDRGRARPRRSRRAGRSAPTATGTRSPSARWASATPPPRRSLAHKLAGLPLDALVGRGTGLDDAGLARKRAILAARRRAHRRRALPPRDALAEYGGFEIAMMAGRDARRRRGAAASSSSTASSPAPPRSSPSPRRRRRAAPSSSPTARPSTATRRCSATSAPSRCSTSTCGSARAPARCSPGRWSAPPRRC